MGFLYLILIIILSVFIICAFVSVFQFIVDITKTKKLRKELKELIKKAKSQIDENNVENVEKEVKNNEQSTT